MVVSTHRITYQGPAALAIQVAEAVAEAEGVELTGSAPPERGDGDTVVLVLTVSATAEAVIDAVSDVRTRLPAAATLTLDDGQT